MKQKWLVRVWMGKEPSDWLYLVDETNTDKIKYFDTYLEAAKVAIAFRKAEVMVTQEEIYA